MAKKRYTLYLSRPLAHKFEAVAAAAPKAASRRLVEDALRAALEPQSLPGVDDALARRLDEPQPNRRASSSARHGHRHRNAGAVRALLPHHHAAAAAKRAGSRPRCSARERFEVFVAQVGRRLASDQRLVSEVLESIATNEPDLFATASDDASCVKAGCAPARRRQRASPDGTAARHPRETTHELTSLPLPPPRKRKAGAGRCCAPPSGRPSPPRWPIPP